MQGTLFPSRRAAVIASPKVAALYYDQILPLPGRDEHLAEAEDLLALPDARTRPLLLEAPSDCRTIVDGAIDVARRHMTAEDVRKRIPAKHYLEFLNPVEQMMYHASCACNIVGSMEVVLPQFPSTPTKKPVNVRKVPQSSVLINLFNLNLVDTRNASWPQILEFREDRGAKAAFAQLRDFLFTSCSDMSIDQLQARLQAIVAEYEAQSKKHGFETKAAAWDVLLNSQNLIKSAAAGGLGLLISKGAGAAALGVAVTPAGLPAVAAASALAGTALAFDVGRAMIAHHRKLSDAELALDRHPANWVLLARGALEKPAAATEPENIGLLRRFWQAIIH